MMPRDTENRPHVVVLGCGFGGLQFCKHLKGVAEITLIDKTNHHLFQPLLYQVAMAGLSMPDIAEPVRTIFRYRQDITPLMDTVQGIDLQKREIRLCRHTITYDYLVIALGGVTTYFGRPEWAKDALGLKSLEDAMEIRKRILTSFELAENTTDLAERKRLMTIVVVGGGPTGVELAGAMAELANQVFKKDFRRIDTRDAEIILIDGGDRILSAYPPELSAAAKRQLESLGVQVKLNERVTEVAADHVTLKSGQRIETHNILWGAGVIANPLTAKLGVPLGPGGRLKVEKDLSLPGHPNVFAIGDIAEVNNDDGTPVPGVAPAAMQMGKHVANVLKREIREGRRPPEQREPFRYWDKGSMATIGRNRGVAWIGRLKFSGFPAWLAWLFVHLVFLVGFRDKVWVFWSWTWSYLTFNRGARIIYSAECPPEVTAEESADPMHPKSGTSEPPQPSPVAGPKPQAAEPALRDG